MNTLLNILAIVAIGAPTAKSVEFTTSDGIKIAADYFAPADSKQKAPVAILIHMFPADRKSWQPLIGPLHDAGFAVLAYDIRGHAGSAGGKDSELSKRYDAHELKLFQDAWRDVEAARKWLSGQKECDVSRIVLVGASIGCSISLDYGGRDDSVKAVACLSPGGNYFGMDSLSAIKKVKTKNILLISPEAEFGEVNALQKASKGVALIGKYPGTRELHGTKILSDKYPRSSEIIKAIVDFSVKSTQEGKPSAGH